MCPSFPYDCCILALAQSRNTLLAKCDLPHILLVAIQGRVAVTSPNTEAPHCRPRQ